MASTYSTNLKLELIGTGDQSGTWGATTNTNLGSLIEEAIAGYVTQAVTDGAATVLTIPDGTSSNGRNYVIELTGVLTANRTVEVPAVDKPYIFFNNTSGGYSVTVKVSGQTGVTIANGKKAIVYTNSTDVIEVANAPVTEAGTQTLTNKTLSSPTITGSLGLTSATSIVVNSSSDALRISQTGAGNALLVEDSTNPDATPFAIDTTGQIITGYTASVTFARAQLTTGAAATATRVQNIGNNTGAQYGPLYYGSTTANANTGVTIARSRGADPVTRGILSSGDTIGAVDFVGDDGANFISAAQIYADVDGTPGTNDMPGRLVFSTTADGASAPTERMRIDSSGNVGIGTSSPAVKVHALTPSATAVAFRAGNSVSFAEFQVDASGNSQLIAPGGVQIFNTNGTERMRIDSSGRVGINTTSPLSMLHVVGTSAIPAMETNNILETSTISATAATGTINYDAATQSVLYYTSNASANWTLNIRASSGTSLNTFMATGDTLTIVHMVTQGATPYYNSAVQVDGSSVTPKWQGGTAPTSGNASAIDVYTYTVIKTASATFTVLASQTQFK
jgi:hypothetical protein